MMMPVSELLNDLGLSALRGDAVPEAIHTSVEQVRRWRTAGPAPEVEAAVRAEAQAAWRRAGADELALWRDTSPPWPDDPQLPGQPDPDPLPLDALPPVLRDHVASVAGATQTPPDMGVLLALAAVSAAVGGRTEVRVDDRDWREPSNIYADVILPPASRKSPVYRHMTAPLVTWEMEMVRVTGPSRQAALDRLRVREGALEATIRAAAGGKVTEMEVIAARAALDQATEQVPPEARVLAADATPEALVRLMAEQGGRIALMSPEGDPLRIADGRYDRNGGARLQELKQAWTGEALSSDRIGRGRVHVARPALTLALTMQPGVLDSLSNARSFRDEGVLGRVLWCMPDAGLGRRLTGRDVPPLDGPAAERYGRMLKTLLDAFWGAGDPTMLELDADALELLYGLEAEVEGGLAPGGCYAGAPDWAGKMTGHALRLAQLVALATRAAEGRALDAAIEAGPMDAGARLARALATHALVVLGGLGRNQRTLDQAYVLRRARELPPGSTLRDLHRAVQGRTSIPDAEALDTLVSDLVRRGCMRLTTPERSGPGRPPSPVVELHPEILHTREVEPVPAMLFGGEA